MSKLALKEDTFASIPNATSGNLTLNFGLVSVPIAMAPLLDESSTPKATLYQRATQEKVRLVYTDSAGNIIPPTDIVKGYTHKDKVVLIEKSELDSLKSDEHGVVQLTAFIPFKQVDPLWIEKTFLIAPKLKNMDQYSLLLTLLRLREDKALIGTYTPNKSTSPKTLVIRYSPYTECLVAHLCNYSDNLRNHHIIGVSSVKLVSIPKDIVDVGLEILERLSDDFNPEITTNTYGSRLQALIEDKSKRDTEETSLLMRTLSGKL